MFLDPDPKRQKLSSGNMSGFFSSQRPIESPRDHRTTIRRKSLPLQESSPSRNNQQSAWHPSSPDKPTVRLVKTSHTESSIEDQENWSDKVQKENRQDAQTWQDLSSNELIKPAKVLTNSGLLPGSVASSLDRNVSDSDNIANGAHAFIRPDSNALLSTNTTHAVSTGSRPEWHSEHRRSGSTDNYSTSSTLKESSEASIFVGQRSESRFSQGTTLRGTPTPYEQDFRERVPEVEDSLRQQTESLILCSLPEDSPECSPENSTVRIVPQSSGSDSTEQPLPSEHSESSVVYLPQTSPGSASNSGSRPSVVQGSFRRGSSLSSIPEPLNIRKTTLDSPTAQDRRSQESSRSELPVSSSPNFVAFDSDSPRPRSRSQPLHYSYSIESISSRLQYPEVHRPSTGRSLGVNSSWASLPPSSSTDTLPPLQVTKKRLRHKPAKLSLRHSNKASYASGSSMAQEEIDTLPYPREPFSSHLSTIASESDRQSRISSQRLSHFSLGSGVLTGDDASSIPLSGTWPRRRRGSAPIDSVASETSPGALGTSSEEDAGDMTLGTFREQSAKPQALFQPRAQNSPGTSRFENLPPPGMLPPLPPIPKSRDSDEDFDKVSALQSPRLREKRSGYSLRRRSNSTPSRSHSRHMSQVSRSESDRWSHASSIFPYWAKQFYGHGAALMSPSKVSLGTHGPPSRGQDGQQGHVRSNSHWTERSITSRLGTGYNEIENPSPTSSHFLPSIFRPRTRGRANTVGNGRSRKLRKKDRREAANREESGTDSMRIHADPLPQNQDGETLPSGQPRYGKLRDGSEPPHRPLPRKYSKQKKWNEMEFPRPMTKDRLSDFGYHEPHLAHTQRASNRLSAWRAPSFVESLDTLWRSRCNRQILLFALGFIFPPFWWLGAVLPIPKKPMTDEEYEKERSAMGVGASEEDIHAAMMKHEAGDAEKRWRGEKAWLKGRWWRYLNRVMSVIGVLVIGAVIALAVVATT